jgi:Fe-S cluster biogenesis protein NfuA
MIYKFRKKNYSMDTAKKEQYIQKINKAIEQIKPYLQADGGDINLIDVTDDLVVKVELLGACGNCPFKIHTLKNGVETAIRKDVPEIKEVISVD